MTIHTCNRNLVNYQCDICKAKPVLINDNPCFSPSLAKSNSGFDPIQFEALYSLEEKNFWFCSRNELITWCIRRFFRQKESFFEIGCGTGFVLSGIQKKFPRLKLYGSDLYVSALTCAKKRVHDVNFFQMDATHIPFKEKFDLIGAFDVIEHIEEDELALSQIYSALKPGGGMILTAPQHPFLWSILDETACHKRRYTNKELTEKIKAAGFTILFKTSFITFLLPAMLISRLRYKRKTQEVDPLNELKINPIINYLLTSLLNIERFFISKKIIKFPIGGSLLVVAVKPENNE